MGDVRLVVQGDDLGMCRAVNEGTLLARREGILTQASVMAPTPWFGEGATMARSAGLPVGIHLTLTCEWRHYRWAPLTAAPSLRAADGAFHRTVEEASGAEPQEAVAEAHAQAARVVAAGLEPTYVDPHMGVSVPRAYRALCDRLGVRFLYHHVEPHHTWDSITILSLGPLQDRTAWFAERLAQLGPGTHFVMSHPAVGSAELRALADPGDENEPWAEPIRVADLAALCAPEVRAVVERRGIELTSVRHLP